MRIFISKLLKYFQENVSYGERRIIQSTESTVGPVSFPPSAVVERSRGGADVTLYLVHYLLPILALVHTLR